MVRSLLCLVVLLTGSLWGPASHADAIEAAIKRAGELMEKGDFAGAAAALMPYRELALMHAHGEGTPVDFVEARVLYEQSVLLGDAPNEALRAGLESRMSEEQRDQATQRIEQWQAGREKKP